MTGMRIALFSDVHGNLTGLQAVLAKLDDLGGADVTIAAGDLIAGNSSTDAVLEALVERDVQMVRGDSDTREKLEHLMAGTYPGPRKFPTAYYQAMAAWLEKNLSRTGWALLDGLPLSVQFEPVPGHRFYVCHAAPEDMTSRTCSPLMPPDQLAPIFDPVAAEAVAFGHSHTPHVRWVGERLYVNVASVAFRPDATSMLTVLSCENGSNHGAHNGVAHWTVEQHQVSYDGGLERERMRQNHVPVPEDFYD